jgi:hypothetical protein
MEFFSEISNNIIVYGTAELWKNHKEPICYKYENKL